MINDVVFDNDVVKSCVGAYLDEQLSLVGSFIESVSDKIPNFSKKYEKSEKLKLYADRAYKFYLELAKRIIANGGLDIDLSRINHLDNSGDQILMSRVRVQDELASSYLAGNPPSYRIYKSSQEERLTLLHNDIVDFKDLPMMIYIDNLDLVSSCQIACKQTLCSVLERDMTFILLIMLSFEDEWTEFSADSFRAKLLQNFKKDPEFKSDVLTQGLIKVDCISDMLVLNNRVIFTLRDGLIGAQNNANQFLYGERSSEIANLCQSKIDTLESEPGVKSMINDELFIQEYKDMLDWGSAEHDPDDILMAYDIRPNWLTCIASLLDEYFDFENSGGVVN